MYNVYSTYTRIDLHTAKKERPRLRDPVKVFGLYCFLLLTDHVLIATKGHRVEF